MPKFEVTLNEDVSYTLIVEANDAEEAGETAEAVFVETEVTALLTCVNAREVQGVEPAADDAELTPDTFVSKVDVQSALRKAVDAMEAALSIPMAAVELSRSGVLYQINEAIKSAEGMC